MIEEEPLTEELLMDYGFCKEANGVLSHIDDRIFVENLSKAYIYNGKGYVEQDVFTIEELKEFFYKVRKKYLEKIIISEDEEDAPF